MKKLLIALILLFAFGLSAEFLGGIVTAFGVIFVAIVINREKVFPEPNMDNYYHKKNKNK